MTIPNPKFQIFSGKDDQFYFRLRAENGEIILSSEGYTAKASCENGIRSVKENAVNQARFENKTTQSGRPYFVLKAANHEIIGTSETYSSESSRDIGIASVMSNAPIAPVEDLTWYEAWVPCADSTNDVQVGRFYQLLGLLIPAAAGVFVMGPAVLSCKKG